MILSDEGQENIATGWTHVKEKNVTQKCQCKCHLKKQTSNRVWTDISALPKMKPVSSAVGREPWLPRRWGGGSRAGSAEWWVFVMQTECFPTSIKEVASVESVQLGLCDRAGLSNLPVIVRELTIYFGVSHGVLRAFGALLSKARTRWQFVFPPRSRGCTVVFLCLLNQRVVLWSSC